MAKRSGPSISVKMITTTTALLLVTVVGVVLVNYYRTGRVYDAAAQKEILDRRAEIQDTGEGGLHVFARAVEPQFQSSQDAEIAKLAQAIVAEDTRTVDSVIEYGVRVAYVVDLNKNVVVACGESKDGVTCKANDRHDNTPPSGDPDKRVGASWKQAVDAWKAANAKPLVSFEAADGGVNYVYFAYPVVASGTTPTAALALADDPGTARLGYVVYGYDLAPLAIAKEKAEKQKTEALNSSALWAGAVG